MVVDPSKGQRRPKAKERRINQLDQADAAAIDLHVFRARCTTQRRTFSSRGCDDSRFVGQECRVRELPLVESRVNKGPRRLAFLSDGFPELNTADPINYQLYERPGDQTQYTAITSG